MTMGNTFGKAHDQIRAERMAEHETMKANAPVVDIEPAQAGDGPLGGDSTEGYVFDNAEDVARKDDPGAFNASGMTPGEALTAGPVVGQVWESRDRRSRGKLFVVSHVSAIGSEAVLTPLDGGKDRVVSLDRFNGASNGYAFVRARA